MLFDMYLFFCLPLPLPKKRGAAEGMTGARKVAKGRAPARAAPRATAKRGKQAAASQPGRQGRRATLRVLEGGRSAPR
ncbi:hypothetical protein LZ198_34025 [Myxococcus sp. K15C18031901]|uniref:hypothetical protein n=1 Tax=Myxococcus dinghuensis TaxID=2906761 RepID=UPI0020A7C3DC|nr:hypothetical protein [Myxococcus dinghuensis]MCP3103906.1 hypothetical protein [Myxococcus dinghuensis]